MWMKGPTPTLVVDANILLSAILGFRSRGTLSRVSSSRSLMTTTEASHEILEVLQRIAPDEPIALQVAEELLEVIQVVPSSQYVDKIADAEWTLANAPASRNGSLRDAHVLALAWTYDADIWSHDRDFAGTGWPSWSSANLAAALAEEAGAAADNP